MKFQKRKVIIAAAVFDSPCHYLNFSFCWTPLMPICFEAITFLKDLDSKKYFKNVVSEFIKD